MFCWLNVFTWQSVDEPAELLLGDVGPAEVQSCWLSPDDAAQHEWRDGLAAVQIYVLPEPLVAAPGETRAADIYRRKLCDEVWKTCFQLRSKSRTHHLFQVLQTRMQTQRSL